MTNYINDYCPFIDDEHEISVFYKEVPILGCIHHQYKKISFECEYGEDNDCPYFQNCRCPIYLSSPDQN